MLKIFSLGLALLLGCSDSDFSRSGDKPNTNNPGNDNQTPREPHQQEPIPPNQRSSNPQQHNHGGINLGPSTFVRTQCWFAVSGVHFGYRGKNNNVTEHQPSFPLTRDGSPIDHGKSFDTAGGVFVHPGRYLYEPGSVIYQAIRSSFDSVAIAPGMHVVIMDSNGRVMIDRKGPYMANSSDYGNSLSHLPNIFKSLESKMPQWMKTYMSQRNFDLEKTPLHAARTVVVKKIPNVPCS